MAERVAGAGRGHGKLILCGEHAVVHGHPALAMGVARSTEVRLHPRPGPTSLEGVPDDAPPDPRLARALRVVLPAEGLAVRIRSDLPVGRGMGSSAALAVALVRAECATRGESPGAAQLDARSTEVERVFHGTPSGVDTAIAARGGMIRFRRASGGPIVEALPAPAWTAVVLETEGIGDTGAMVAAVAARRPGIDPLLERIGALVARAEAVLQDPAALGPILLENHALLRRIGVSTPALDAAVDLAMQCGAYGAKLTGAGGGGNAIALAPDAHSLVEALRSRGATAYECRLAAPGGGT